MAQINKSSDYFNTVLWNGNSSTQAITGVGFQPDFNWIKVRTDIDNHILSDSVRSLNTLNSDRTTQELGPKLSSFDSDGFTCTSDSTVNGTGQTYVGWNWLAGGTGVSNTDGSITSTVSANTTSGFSIVTYTGTGSVATVGHGLGTVPAVMIIKSRSNPPADHWWVYHQSNGNTGSQFLNLTNGFTTASNDWNNTSPTSSVFTIGTQTGVNYNGGDFVAYCFLEKKGFSKFGSYTGNGSADGSFVYTGLKPAWLLVKRTDSATSWKLLDNKRDAYNDGTGANLNVNDTSAEDNNSVYAVDFLSNGFKMRNTNANFNASGGTYIYMCFAESPFVGSDETPTTAR